MVEKYKGILPPGSIWYSLNREEAIVLLLRPDLLKNMSHEIITAIGSASDLQADNGKISKLEQAFKDAGLIIATLYD